MPKQQQQEPWWQRQVNAHKIRKAIKRVKIKRRQQLQQQQQQQP